ncbi:MAG: methylated-DNA--[protein]-cysteine S-methyltransferase [Oscillospiraceae bacterium]|nr:methylated-DNA--[protein]-cysteine S-methyltransferase [Oscillospiraceae bacterium]
MLQDYTFHYQSPLGDITLASDGDALTGLWFEGQKYYAETLNSDHAERALPVFEEALRWLDLYFGGEKPGFIPKLNMRTTAFRKTVWSVLLTIPYGETRTYKQVAEETARRLGLARMSAQAVGGAVGHNAISLIIPCHRVIGTDGGLTGYAGGLEKKAYLLRMEHHARG